MRKFSLVLVAAMLFSTASILANNEIETNPAKKLKAQITALLADHDLKESGIAQVRFTLNKDKEIVVLSIDTNDDSIAYYVKNRLNYKKVDIKEVKEGKLYTIPVRLQ